MRTTLAAVVILLSVVSGGMAQMVVSTMAQPAAAKPGENATFHCVVDQDILNPATSFCQWERPGGWTIIPGAYPEDDFEFIRYPEGTADAKRRCDFVLRSVKAEHHGAWKCQPSLVTGPVSDAAMHPVNFIVAAAPEPRRPVIEYRGREEPVVEITADQEVRLTCNLFRTRPKPDFHWYKVSPKGMSLEPIHGAQVVEGEIMEPGTDDLRSYNSTISLKVGSHENAMKIRCVANHTMLTADNNGAEITLNVQGQATVRQCVRIGSGMSQSIVENYYCDQRAYYLAGKESTIEVVFAANPAPRRLEWIVPRYPSNPVASGETRDGFRALQWEKFSVVTEDQAMTDQLDRPDLYSAKLKIDDLAAEGVAGRYEVRIFNGVNDERTGDQASRFRFDVQIGEKPPQGMGAGGIVGIIIAALVIIIVVVVIFAWRSSRMCFAGRARKTDPDAEIAEETPVTATAAKDQSEAPNAAAADEKSAATNGNNNNSASTGLKGRLSKFLPKAGSGANKKTKDKDGCKAEKVPLDVKSSNKGQTDVEQLQAGNEGDKSEEEKQKKEQTLIYADLDLIKNTNDGPGEKNTILSSEKTEYAEIIGTVKPADEKK